MIYGPWCKKTEAGLRLPCIPVNARALYARERMIRQSQNRISFPHIDIENSFARIAIASVPLSSLLPFRVADNIPYPILLVNRSARLFADLPIFCAFGRRFDNSSPSFDGFRQELSLLSDGKPRIIKKDGSHGTRGGKRRDKTNGRKTADSVCAGYFARLSRSGACDHDGAAAVPARGARHFGGAPEPLRRLPPTGTVRHAGCPDKPGALQPVLLETVGGRILKRRQKETAHPIGCAVCGFVRT